MFASDVLGASPFSSSLLRPPTPSLGPDRRVEPEEVVTVDSHSALVADTRVNRSLDLRLRGREGLEGDDRSGDGALDALPAVGGGGRDKHDDVIVDDGRLETSVSLNLSSTGAERRELEVDVLIAELTLHLLLRGGDFDRVYLAVRAVPATGVENFLQDVVGGQGGEAEALGRSHEHERALSRYVVLYGDAGVGAQLPLLGLCEGDDNWVSLAVDNFSVEVVRLRRQRIREPSVPLDSHLICFSPPHLVFKESSSNLRPGRNSSYHLQRHATSSSFHAHARLDPLSALIPSSDLVVADVGGSGDEGRGCKRRGETRIRKAEQGR
mmetsp:Transcript_25803/g.58077  ORF Transcript_25803/g.58077 Transcript_25803/m.58077 type:complete len:324 (-) Transcript_25803:88-1059(-)